MVYNMVTALMVVADVLGSNFTNTLVGGKILKTKDSIGRCLQGFEPCQRRAGGNPTYKHQPMEFFCVWLLGNFINMEDNFAIQITCKGAVFGAEMLVNCLQYITHFKKRKPNPTVDDLVNGLYAKIKVDLARAKLNKDGTIDPDDAVVIGQLESMADNFYQQNTKNE